MTNSCNLLGFPYLMTVTPLSECGKEKLKNWHVIPANSGNPECLVMATRLQLRAQRGRGEADVAIQKYEALDCYTLFSMTARVS